MKRPALPPALPRATIAGALTGLALLATPASATVEIKAITGLPGHIPNAANFLNFMEEANKISEGLYKFNYIGGPEVTPSRKAGAAFKRGLYGAIYSPSSYYAGLVPENAALVASNIPVEKMRSNGAYELLREVWSKKLHGHIIGWFDWSVGHYIYLAKAPERLDGGGIKFEGLRLRGSSTHRDFFAKLGATPISMSSREVRTGIERGVVDGLGWPGIGAVGIGLGGIVKYRLDPRFYRGNQAAVIHNDVWARLPQKAKDILSRFAEEYETSGSVEYLAGVREKEQAQLRKEGMGIIEQDAEQRRSYLRAGYDVKWEELAGKSDYAARLQKLMYDPSLF